MHLHELSKICEEHCFLVKRFLEHRGDDVLMAAERMASALIEGKKILLFGNGGSAADAQHISSELVGRFLRERPGLPSIALTSDTSAITSIANDYGFELVFARQIEALGQKGDVAIAISTSGRSANVIEGLRAARDRGLYRIALLGKDGGAARELADIPLVVSAEKTQRIQEVHCLIGHLLCEAVERRMFEKRD